VSTIEVRANEPLTNTEENRILEPIDPWSDAMAKKITVQDFSAAESYRTANHDWRFRIADELYLGWVQQKYWEGTKIPRASVPVFVAFEQVEALLPKIMSAIFAEDPWFQTDPDLAAGTTARDARDFQALVIRQMEDTSAREVMRRAIKSAMIYGNGIAGLSWESEEVKSLKYVARWKQPAPPPVPMNGNILQMLRPPGRPRRVLDKVQSTEIVNRPKLEYISLKDFYIDPNCPSPIIQDAAYCCVRALKPIAYFDGLRKNKEFNIPSNEELVQLAKMKPSAQGDITKAVSESMRSASWAPQNDKTVDPAGKRMEVIARWSEDRVVWVLNREIPILNKPNPYGLVHFYDAFYADVLDRFYAQGICDVVEGEQRLQVAILGNRLDELSLNIHRPVQVRRGLNVPAYQLRVRPGQVIPVDTPGADYKLTEVSEITGQVYIEVNASEARVQKTTGLTDLIATGMPQSGGNSASRTATGIGAIVNAGSSRIQYLVENLEDTFIEPILNGVVSLNQLYPPIALPLAKVVALAKLKFYMRASARMQSKMALMQTFPLIMQSVANPAFMAQLAQIGQTVDFAELFNMVLDMTGYRNRADLIRSLTPAEQQMLKQPPPDQILKERMQDKRIQSQAVIQRGKQDHQTQLEQMRLEADQSNESRRMYSELTKALMPVAIKHALEPEEANT